MKPARLVSVALVALLGTVLNPALGQTSAGTAFTYQGRLKEGGQPVHDTADFQFSLWDALADGNQVGSTVLITGVGVDRGLFTVTLDFGEGAFTGDARWLEIAVRSPAGGGYTALSPRQELTMTPYALHASKAAAASDADTVDTLHASAAPTANTLLALNGSAKYPNSVLTMGAGSGLDADLLDGEQGAFYQDASNINAGTLGDAYLSSNVALLNMAQTFSANNYFMGLVGVGTSAPSCPLHAEDGVANDDAPAIYGKHAVTDHRGIGIHGTGGWMGVYGEVSPPTGNNPENAYVGVYGAVSGGQAQNTGVQGNAYSSGSNTGVRGWADGGSTNTGVLGICPGTGRGVYGWAGGTSGTNYGVFGQSDSLEGWAGYFRGRGYFTDHLAIGGGPENAEGWSRVLDLVGAGHAKLSIRTTSIANIDARVMAHCYGFWGAPTGMVIGTSTNHAVSFGTNAATRMTIKPDGWIGIGTTNPAAQLHVAGSFTPAVYAQSNAASPIGVGVKGVGGLWGIEGTAQPPSADGWYVAGVYGHAEEGAGENIGVYGSASGGATNYAGYFNGDVHVRGTLSKGSGSFKIDHPLDPENKYLYHSFVESPDMKNIYDGVVLTDGKGYATVALPEWFETLNRDFRYQLTVLDETDSSAFAQAKVVRKMAGNQFAIRTSRPHVEVSWQITGIRRDPFANANRIPVEEDKRATERGRYLHPEAWGLSQELGIDYQREHATHERRQACVEGR